MQQELLETASQCGVSIRGEHLDSQYTQVYIKPVTAGVRLAKERLAMLLAEVNNSVVEHKVAVSPEQEAEIRKFDASKFKTLILLENGSCIILGKRQHANRAHSELQQLLKFNPSRKERLQVRQRSICGPPPGCTIQIESGDITKEKVDVIVNAANENLEHGGGVAKAIATRGGWKVQQESREYTGCHGKAKEAEAIWTTAGDLDCKNVVHTVPPSGNHIEDMNRTQHVCFQMHATTV
jgi:hypothetical protein